MQELITRPTAADKKIKTSEDFELCYMRHQYLRRVKFNPTEDDMKPFMYIVTNLTRHTYHNFSQLFKIIGMYDEDVINIGRIHLVSFLGLYALDQNAVKKAEFEDVFERRNFKKPESADYLQKDRAIFSLFLKQRMEDLVRVCRQKARNVRGQVTEQHFVFFGRNKPPKNTRELLTRHREFEYHKLDYSIFKSIRKKADISADCNMFQFNSTWYVVVAVDQKGLAIDDLMNSNYNPYENYHTKKPDDLIMEKECERLCKGYGVKTDLKKALILRQFVSRNKNDKKLSKEVSLARKLLRKGDFECLTVKDEILKEEI